MRRLLDKLYAATLWGSALCLAAIALLVGAQLAGRLLDGTLALVHLPRTDFVILSLNEICGYLLAGASFLGARRHAQSRRAYPRHHGARLHERARTPLCRNLGLRFCRRGLRLHDRQFAKFAWVSLQLPRSLDRRGTRAARLSAGRDGASAPAFSPSR